LILFLFEQGVQMLTEKNWIFSPIEIRPLFLSHSFRGWWWSLLGHKNAASSQFCLEFANPRPIVLSGFNYANEMARRRFTCTNPLRSQGYCTVWKISSRLYFHVCENKSLFITLFIMIMNDQQLTYN